MPAGPAHIVFFIIHKGQKERKLMQWSYQKLMTVEVQLALLAVLCTFSLHVRLGTKLHGCTCLENLFIMSPFSLDNVHLEVMEAHSR